MLNKITNIALDYQKGLLLINDKVVTIPAKITVKEPDGWDLVKLVNPELAKQGIACPELVIDARGLVEYLKRQEFKELIRDVVREEIPAELAGTAGTDH